MDHNASNAVEKTASDLERKETSPFHEELFRIKTESAATQLPSLELTLAAFHPPGGGGGGGGQRPAPPRPEPPRPEPPRPAPSATRTET